MNHDLTLLRNYLNSFVALNDQEWESLNELLYIQEYEKKELFLAEGKVAT